MKILFTRLIAFVGVLFALTQCTFNQQQDAVKTALSPQRLASDESFIKIVAATNNLQFAIYNKLRDAHSQVLRKQDNARIQQLLRYNTKDSLVSAIQYLGFSDVMVCAAALDTIKSANKRLISSGTDIHSIPLSVITEAYKLASDNMGHIYPPIKRSANALKLESEAQTNGYEVCPECFLNNCNECEFGQDNGGGSTEVQPTYNGSGGGGLDCRTAAQSKRTAQINTANAWLAVQLTLECGSVAWGAGAAACSGTAATIVGAPVSPAAGVGVGCVVYVGCDIYQIYQYRQQIAVIEADYTMSMYGCK